MIEHATFILSFFVVFFVLLLIYDIVSLYKRKNEQKMDQKKKEKLMNLIEKKEKNIKNSTKKIIKKLKSLSYLYVFCNMLEENTQIENQNIRDIVSKKQYQTLFSTLAFTYQKKDELEKAYYAYMLQFIKINQPEIDSFLFSCVTSKSLYCKENALQAFYRLGDSDKVVASYQIMSKQNTNYGYKLVADGLSNFTGSKQELCSKLYEQFDDFKEPFKIGFLTFFRQCKYDLRKELINRLQTSKNIEKEVEIEIIRYFSKVIDKKASIILLERLENNYYKDFEYDVVIIQTLAHYPSEKAKKVLTKSLSNYNYYVRYNAAKSLMAMTDLKKITGLTDPFAQEMIQSLISQEV